MPQQQTQVLVIGHPLVVDANRKFWSYYAQLNDLDVDLVCPQIWRSNLISSLKFVESTNHDRGLRKIFPIRCYNKGNASLFFFAPFSLWRILARYKYDHILLTQEVWSVALLVFNIILTLTWNRKTPLFIFANQNIKKRRYRWLHLYERWNARKVVGHLYCSTEVKEVLQWKRVPGKYIYLPFSFDDELYQQYIPPTALQSSPLRIGYLGRLSTEKGVDTLLAAVNNSSLSQQVQLVIAGAGELEEKFRQQKEVLFLGVIPHAQAHKFYEKIDLFVLPSLTTSFWKEQFGRVLIEAAAAGKFVIGSSSGAIPEVLGHLKLPYIFNEGDVDSLVTRVEEVLALIKGKSAMRIVENAQQIAFAKFSHSAVAKELFKQISLITEQQ